MIEVGRVESNSATSTDEEIDQKTIDVLEEMLKQAKAGNLDTSFLFYTLHDQRSNEPIEAPSWHFSHTSMGGEILAVHSMCYMLGAMMPQILGSAIARIEKITGGFASRKVDGTVN